ncbi:MAG: FecR domain-containing protein [Betaproteobacteria bacterium]
MKNIRVGTAAFLFLLFAFSASAEDERFYIHSAERGDTLLKLANRYLNNRNDWQLFQIFNTINNPRAIPLGTKIRIPASAMRGEPAPGQVIAASGSVTSASGSILPGSKVNEGDRLRTGDDSFVTIKLADGSILTVQPKSIVRMQAARQLANTGGVTDTVVRLDSGRVETSVVKQKNAAARYEIRTPTSNMGVRGTLFRVGADESGKKGQGEVVDGLVAVSGATAPSAGTQILALAAGFGTIVEAGKPPSPPVALLPPPDVAALPAQFQNPDVVFTFKPVPAAGSYRAQVAMDKEFTNLIANASSATPAVKFANLPDGSLFLRVRGVDVNGLEGKDATHAFVVKARPLPPQLSTPVDKDRLLTSNVTLSWQAAPDAVSYRAQLATDATFASPLTDEKVASGVSLSPTVMLKSASYYWRVASVNTKGEIGPWSAVRTFVGAADQPVLNAKRAAGAMSLEIDASAAQTHQVQIARDERFIHVASDRNVTGNNFDLGDIAVGAYYIRVRAVIGSEKAVGPWSEPRLLEVYPFGGGWWLSESQSPMRAPASR